MGLKTRTVRVVGGVGASAVLGMAALTASPAQAADGAVDKAAPAAFPCTILKTGGSGANVRLWWCDGMQGTRRGYHAQGYLAGGGAVWLVSAAGDPVAFTTSGVSGWFDSKTVGDFGAPWKACKHNGPITSPHECTGYGSR